MQQKNYDQQTFDKDDFSAQDVSRCEFANCLFKGCLFSGSHLSGTDFIDCRFEHCDMSMANLQGTGLKNVHFRQCKLIGIDFSACNDFLFAVGFEGCLLDYTYFFKKKLKKTVFKDCSLKEANFTQADATASGWHGCDLSRTIFARTVLDKADFRFASNFSIDPASNSLKKARFSLAGLPGLLDAYDIVVE